MPASFIEDFYAKLGLPQQTHLDARIYKKQILENAELTSTDRKWVNEDIESLKWKYTLKPGTIAIPRYEDGEREYLEIALLHVDLKSPTHSKRLGEVIQRAIPYPVVLVFENKGNLLINLADKRKSRGDSSKLTVELFFDTGWLIHANLAPGELGFLESFRASLCSHENLYAFYQDLISRIVALESERLTGIYRLDRTNEVAEARHTVLVEVQRLQSEITALRSSATKEKQINRRVEINLELRQLESRIAELKKNL